MDRELRIKTQRQTRRLKRTRKKLLENKSWPRLSVFRSNMHLYAQVIDDKAGVTLFSIHEKELGDGKMTKVERAGKLGEALAQKAKDKKIEKVMFDKGSYRYHGRVRAFAEGARKGGLQF